MKIYTTLLFFAFLTLASHAQSQTEIVSAFEKSYTQEKNGEFKQAAETLKTVYKTDSYELNLRIGWLLYNAGLFTESAAHYNKAISLKPYAEEAKLGLIMPKTALGKWNEVIKLYQNILEINPQNTIANYRMGLIYYEQKNYTQANIYFDKVLNLYPFDYDTLLMSAWNHYFMGKTKEAIVLFYKVLMNTPSSESAKEGLKLLE